jgi:RNA polymerase-binding transcription factor DksA
MLTEQLRARGAELSEEVREEREDSDTERNRRTTREVQDRGDEATTEQWREANEAMIGHHQGEIQGIKAALSRMTSGTYGQCVDCGDLIGFERLRAYPSASRCLACQSKAEST